MGSLGREARRYPRHGRSRHADLRRLTRPRRSRYVCLYRRRHRLRRRLGRRWWWRRWRFRTARRFGRRVGRRGGGRHRRRLVDCRARSPEYEQYSRHHERGSGKRRRDERDQRLLGAIPRRRSRFEVPGVLVERIESVERAVAAASLFGGLPIGRIVCVPVLVRIVVGRREFRWWRLRVPRVVPARYSSLLRGRRHIADQVVEVPRGFAFNHIQMLALVPGQMRVPRESRAESAELAPARRTPR